MSTTTAPVATTASVADELRPLLTAFLGHDLPVRFEFWDGSGLGPHDGPGTVRLRSADAIRRLVWAPGQLGVARAYVAGDLDLEGDLFTMLRALQSAAPPELRFGVRTIAPTVAAAQRLGVLGRRPAPPPEEARPSGRLHSKRR